MLRNPCAYSVMPGIGSSLFTLPAVRMSRSSPAWPDVPSGPAQPTVFCLGSTWFTVPSTNRIFRNRAASDTRMCSDSTTPPATCGISGRYRK